ncbi:MAG: 1-(5-phosphoribosyl)-5-[(5-phosphoribosylamino)methylideneamino]imidazole-4-carboxamide isomerase [Spirochaetales bacterium]|jgi:phosphoribosylformimino-5-aminoimidazole carboxamide ribotide isomerase|nr:1-(5-phosphoribosyl)-5-[(5-phosphoribosylamino)methylideneamino]imidazole-4-carboxamide isomerase [Spirochaetales bacterium]|tara:strand:- start:6230 stop:6961 length:732 start_codon:yes stop_codon:yes gene_type:complete
MLLIPAIDIKDQKCVRLFKGDFDKQTIYSDNPLDVSIKWQLDGAQLIHIVDLDGALEGESKNFQAINTILSNSKCEFQIGGGIRNLKTIEDYMSIGAKRVILGTSAFIDEDFFQEACKMYLDKIAVGLDIKDDKVAIKGWNTKIDISLKDAIQRFENLKVPLIVLTSVDRDGTLEGFNKTLIKDYLKLSNIPIIISGGIKDESDLKEIQSMNDERIYGVILGKSLYEKKINLKNCIKEYSDVG